MTEDYLYFGSDYLEGAHERILERLIEVNRQPVMAVIATVSGPMT